MGNLIGTCASDSPQREEEKTFLMIKNEEMQKEINFLRKELTTLQTKIRASTVIIDTSEDLPKKTPINRSGIDEYIKKLLDNPDCNVSWMPDSVESKLYSNILNLILNIVDEALEGTEIRFLGQTLTCDLQ